MTNDHEPGENRKNFFPSTLHISVDLINGSELDDLKLYKMRYDLTECYGSFIHIDYSGRCKGHTLFLRWQTFQPVCT